MISWGIAYHRLRTVNLYRILAYSSEVRPSRAYSANMAGKSEDFDKALKFALANSRYQATFPSSHVAWVLDVNSHMRLTIFETMSNVYKHRM